MKQIFLCSLLVFLCASVNAQKTERAEKDTMVTFPVSGVCEMCKDRIEEAAKGKGVRLAVWDIDKKILTLVYNPSLVSEKKVRNRIVAAGHDSGPMKADDDVYNALDECCHYREINSHSDVEHPEKSPGDSANAVGHESIMGVVMEEDKKGNFSPLIGASIIWLGTTKGTVTDSSGVFSIKKNSGSSKLIISYSGFRSDTVDAEKKGDMIIVLAAGSQLSEVKVLSRQKSSFVSSFTTMRTQIMTEKELFKAACCNLSESFETNPSVDVSYNDAVTGSKQIQLLGLSGNYTQLTVESMPGPRGLATPLGLNFIAGPWVESIQLNKGVGSVANGFESIAGQINVELKKPEKSDRLYLNAYINDNAKTDLNLVLTKKLGKKWSTALLLHDNFLTRTNVDFNKDGFRDMTTGNLFSAVSRWKYDDGKGWAAQLGIKLLTDQRTGGEIDFDPGKDKLSTVNYGLGINTTRFETFGKLGYVFPEKKYKSIGLQLSVFSHRQDSYFGTTVYDGKQNNFYANLIYQSIIGTTAHKFRTGLSFLSDTYNELFRTTRYQRTENIPGTFFEYTFTPVEKFSVVAGIRADYNSLFGWFSTPRLHVRYEPVKGTIIRLSAGRGQRTANIFAENSSVFVSSRHINIITSVTGKAYGLDPEVAWNKGISLDQKLRLFNRDASLSFDFFRNDFSKQVVVDIEKTHEVHFYNLNGKSFSNSFQAELTVEPVKKLDLRFAYRFFDVKATYNGKLLQRPFTARHRAFANIAYELEGWKFDYTLNYNGTKRIPPVDHILPGNGQSSYSPEYVVMNAQISKSLGRKKLVDLYFGGENLTGYMQHDAIISPDQPFGPYFDASLVWGPVSGRLIYVGFRYKIK
ncbi:MAG: carboxypeptidase-like regulatory domain-containing protein [Sphingobacteriales bacterium]|nr:carboxypeptidase-like regulatory domain-containing protein [Sphingobacteriales bacterium]